jgi:hypothetical protein
MDYSCFSLVSQSHHGYIWLLKDWLTIGEHIQGKGCGRVSPLMVTLLGNVKFEPLQVRLDQHQSQILNDKRNTQYKTSNFFKNILQLILFPFNFFSSGNSFGFVWCF